MRGSRADLRLALRVGVFIMAAAAGLPQDHAAESRLSGEAPKDPQIAPGEGAKKIRRLETVTWNPVTDELTWVVSSGSKSGEAYLPGSKETYLIHLDSATMSYKNEGRRFSEDEANYVHMVVDLISRYAVESTVWWETGHGEKVDKDRKDSVPEKKEDDKKPPAPVHPSATPIADNGTDGCRSDGLRESLAALIRRLPESKVR